MLVSNLSFLLYFSLIYIIGLVVLYFSKTRINNLENIVYKWLLCLNLFGIILQICCDLVSKNYDKIPHIITMAVLSLFLVYFIA